MDVEKSEPELVDEEQVAPPVRERLVSLPGLLALGLLDFDAGLPLVH